MTREIVHTGRMVGRTATLLAAEECERCRDERPCDCGPDRCRCTCGRCMYPGPLPGDGPEPTVEVLPPGPLGWLTHNGGIFGWGGGEGRPPIDDQRGRR